jgi:hypothetical protein
MYDLLYILPLVLFVAGFFLNYKAYKKALYVYRNDVSKASRILWFTGEKMMREDLADPFYHNNQKELTQMIKLRTYSIILIVGGIFFIVYFNIL